MEHTEGLNAPADVWVGGVLMRVCDGISPSGRPCPPGPLENVGFRYTTDENIDWPEAVLGNAGRRLALEPLKGWSYLGFGRVVQIMPVIIQFDSLRMEDGNWTNDQALLGRYVRVPIDRLEIVPEEED